MRIAWALLAASVVLVDSSPAWAQSVGPELPATATAAPVAPVTGTAGSPARGAQTAVRDAEAAPLPTPEDPATAADLAAARAASPEATSSSGSRPASGLPAESEVTIDRRNAVVAGLRFGGPIGAAVRLSLLHGLGADVREKNERVDAVCSVPIPHCAGGFLLDAEAGSGGGKLSLGVGANAKVQSEDFRGTVGAGLKLSLARTWGSPIGTEPGLTYLGPELDLYVLRVGVNLGVLWRVAGNGGSSALFAWGLGLRL